MVAAGLELAFGAAGLKANVRIKQPKPIFVHT